MRDEAELVMLVAVIVMGRRGRRDRATCGAGAAAASELGGRSSIRCYRLAI